MKIVRAYLAVDCPMDGVVKFDRCKGCKFNDYESLTEYAVECTFTVGEFTTRLLETNR